VPVNAIRLLHDPGNGALPAPLARRYRAEHVDFNTAGPASRCGRCSYDLDVHVWQLIDPDVAEQRGVIDCGTTD
jgi:hypothetical protein